MTVFDQFRQKFSSRFIQNLGWLSLSEIIIRIVRLATTVILARFLSEYDYGLAAIVLTVNEFTQMLTRCGISAKLIQVEEERLETLANSAYWLSWLIYLGLFVIQCISAFAIAIFYRDNQLIIPICATAIIYLIVPIAQVQATLIQRENRLKIIAVTNALQISIGNVLTALFAFLGFGMWAIVLPRVLVAPLWVIINYHYHDWRPKRWTTDHWGELFRFGRHVLGVELLKTLRNNLDYLIVGRMVGVRELGLYYFAFNAGLGISLSFITAINTALYPHLCAARANWQQFQQRYFHSLKITAFIIVPIVLLQSSLAPIYVPIVFSQKWIEAIPILMLICLSAIPRPFAEAASAVWLAIDKPKIDLIGSVVFTIVLAIALLIGTQWQLTGVAIAVLATHVVFQPLFTLLTTRFVMQRTT
ncbi:similar to polysaccharide biosynthesis export protein [Leptolyngbya sp. NIES-3755]|nr:similar to polysaccharide biosynthesis export protein [Leptolyngbya sp. NIES-3755]